MGLEGVIFRLVGSACSGPASVSPAHRVDAAGEEAGKKRGEEAGKKRGHIWN